jgi:hypothetical protein
MRALILILVIITTRCHSSENNNLDTPYCENLIFYAMHLKEMSNQIIGAEVYITEARRKL